MAYENENFFAEQAEKNVTLDLLVHPIDVWKERYTDFVAMS